METPDQNPLHQNGSWIRRPLGEVIDFSNGKAIKATDSGIYPVYGANGIIGYTNQSLHENGIIIGRVGAYCGSTERCESSFWASDNAIVAIPRPNSLDTRYAYFLLSNANLNIHAGGAAQPLLTQERLRQLQLPLPPLPTQKKIASILSAYDDLIENNNRRIKILEEMAQNIYREWFVHFRYPGHEDVPMVDSELGQIPQGWEICTLGSVCKVIPGYAFKKTDWTSAGIPVVKIKNIKSNKLIDLEEVDFVSPSILDGMQKFLLEDGDMLIAMTGATAGKVGKLRTPKSAFLNQRVAKIEAINSIFKHFVWGTISTQKAQERFFKLADGAAQPNMSGSQIESTTLVIPDKALVESFGNIIGDIQALIDTSVSHNQNLRQTRDLLLPKLISGQLDVEELDIAV